MRHSEKENASTIDSSSDGMRRQLADSSRKLADLTASMVYDNPLLLKDLLEITWLDRDPWSQRASRVVSICCCRFPELFRPYCSEVIRKLVSLKTEGAKRNFLKILAEVPVKLTKKDKLILINLCFDYMAGVFAVAIKVYSMQILYNLSMEIPEIGIELSNLIENDLPDATPGYKSRGEKILKKLHGKNVP